MIQLQNRFGVWAAFILSIEPSPASCIIIYLNKVIYSNNTNNRFLDKPVTVHFMNELANDQPIIKMRVEASLRKIEFQSLFTSELTEGVIKEINNATDI